MEITGQELKEIEDGWKRVEDARKRIRDWLSFVRGLLKAHKYYFGNSEIPLDKEDSLIRFYKDESWSLALASTGPIKVISYYYEKGGIRRDDVFEVEEALPNIITAIADRFPRIKEDLQFFKEASRR